MMSPALPMPLRGLVAAAITAVFISERKRNERSFMRSRTCTLLLTGLTATVLVRPRACKSQLQYANETGYAGIVRKMPNDRELQSLCHRRPCPRPIRSGVRLQEMSASRLEIGRAHV